MDKPIFIKCNIMLPSRELEYERLQIKKQIEEDGLVVLPPGFELADVDVSLLEQIKKELQSGLRFDAEKMRSYLNSEDIERIFIKYIDELKGENK